MVRGTGMRRCAIICAVFCALVWAAAAGADEYLTVVGEINYDFQIVTDTDAVYNILLNNAGYDVTDHIGERLRIVGMVVEEGGEKYIDVESFEVLGEGGSQESAPSDQGEGEAQPKQ